MGKQECSFAALRVTFFGTFSSVFASFREPNVGFEFASITLGLTYMGTAAQISFETLPVERDARLVETWVSEAVRMLQTGADAPERRSTVRFLLQNARHCARRLEAEFVYEILVAASQLALLANVTREDLLAEVLIAEDAARTLLAPQYLCSRATK